MAVKKVSKAKPKKLAAVPRGLVKYNYRGTMHTGSVTKVVKHGSTPASTILEIRPTQHFAGESATIHRHANKVSKTTTPIRGHSHQH